MNAVHVLGNDGDIVWDCRPCVCYPAGGFCREAGFGEWRSCAAVL